MGMPKKIQAKHVDEAKVIDYVGRYCHENPDMCGAIWWTMREELFPDVPERVLLSKLAALVRRNLLEGCTCGCRGDFQIVIHPVPPPESEPSNGTWVVQDVVPRFAPNALTVTLDEVDGVAFSTDAVGGRVTIFR